MPGAVNYRLSIMDEKIKKILLPVVLLMASVIRVYPIGANLPYAFWHDENNYIEMALRFGTGNFRLSSYSHGGLFQLVLFIEYAIYYAAARLIGYASSTTDFLINYLKDPSVLFMIARLTVALCGIGIVYLTFLIAAKIFNARTALIASIFTALSLLMVQMSSLALADIPAVLISLSAFLVIVHSLEKPIDNRMYYIACLLTGLATTCKYYAVFGMAPLYVAAFIKCKDIRVDFSRLAKFILLGSAVAVIGFIIGIPSFILDIPRFYKNTFVRMGGEYILTNPNRNAWLYYFTNHLRNGLGLPLEYAALAGIAYALYKHSRHDVLILSTPIASYLILMHSMGFAYHSLPAVPFILILAARFLDAIGNRFFLKTPFYTALFLGISIVTPTFLDSIKLVRIFTSQDTRIEAKAWVDGMIAQDATILEEGYIHTIPVHGPPLAEDLKTLKRDRDYIISHGGNGRLIDTRIKNYEKIYGGFKKYNILKMERLTKEAVDVHRPRYIILTRANDILTGKELLYYLYFEKDYLAKRQGLKEDIMTKYRLIKSFLPTQEFTPLFPHLMNQDYESIRASDLNRFDGYKQGPSIDIFEAKTN